MPTVLLADDHAMVRAGLRAMLELEPEIEIAGECHDGDEALAACRELRPQLLIVDLGMRGKPLAELARALRTEQPALKMLVLTGDLTEKSLRHALAVGVDGYVVKSDEIEELVVAISAVLAGECYVSSALAKSLSLPLGDDREVTRNRELTQRELEVLALIGQGLSSAIIAEKLGLAVRTVRKHRENILRKLDMHNMAQLTAYGIKAGLLT